MDGIYEMTAAPTPITIGEEQYLFGPITLHDYGIIEQQILSELKRPFEALPAMLKPLDEKQQRQLLEIAWTDEVRGPRLKQRDVLDWLATRRGAVFRIWLGLKKNHPEITLDKANELYERATRLESIARESGEPVGNCQSPVKPGMTEIKAIVQSLGAGFLEILRKALTGPPSKSPDSPLPKSNAS